MSKQHLTPAQAADVLDVSPVTLRKWAARGWIQADVTAGGHRRYRKQELERFADSRGIQLEWNEGKPLRILVVDDDPQMLRYMQELLSGLPYPAEVLTAGDGFEAGVQVAVHNPNIMLLDLNMPALDGFSVCDFIKSNPRFSATRIIAITGNPAKANLERILKAGAECCIAKPFTMNEIFAAIGSGDSGAHFSRA